MTKKIYLCMGGNRCICKSSHRSDICEEMVKTGNKIQEKGLEYYLGHEKYSKDPQERWVNEMVQCKNKGRFRLNCNGFFDHRMVLCNKHYPKHKEWNDRSCGICGSPHRSCCC